MGSRIGRRWGVLVLASALAACGGGGGDAAPVSTPTYGAGALFEGTVGGVTTSRQSMIAGRSSQSDADAFALATCNTLGVTGCEIAVRFGPGRCGAIAYGSNNPTGTRIVTVWGGGEGATLQAAQSAAVAACNAKGATNCAVSGSNSSTCNDPA